MPTFTVTFDVSVVGVATRTLTRPVIAPTLEAAIALAKTDLVIIVLKAVQETAP